MIKLQTEDLGASEQEIWFTIRAFIGSVTFLRQGLSVGDSVSRLAGWSVWLAGWYVGQS